MMNGQNAALFVAVLAAAWLAVYFVILGSLWAKTATKKAAKR
jgi:hypothetical protein